MIIIPVKKVFTGGRSIGINQDGIDIGYDSQGNWLGSTPDADLYLFLLDFAGPMPKAEFTGTVRTENGPFRLKDSGGGLVVDDFDMDGHLRSSSFGRLETENVRTFRYSR